jgi:hypothetical protein
MRKQVAVVIDASGSMFQPASPDCVHDKVVEAAESVKWMVEDIRDHLEGTDQWAVSFWYFATSAQQLIGQSHFTSLTDDLFVDIIKDTVDAATNQAQTQAAIGSMTDIYAALHEVSDWMQAHPPTWSDFPIDGPPDKKTIFFFTDGHQTVSHGGTTRAAYEAELGVDFQALLGDRDFILSAQGIGSDLLNATLEDLRDTAAPGSVAKVIAETPPYEADCSAAIMTNALKAVNDNGVLLLRPVGRAASGLLWEQFRLPALAPVQLDQSRLAATMVPAARTVNYADFEVEVDGISKQLILGLTWHQPGSPSIQARSPSGVIFSPGVAPARYLREGWMASLHIPEPEAGTWHVRVLGDRRQAPLRLNLLARGTNPAFSLTARSEPRYLAAPGSTEVRVTPWLDGKVAFGSLRVEARRLGGGPVLLSQGQDGVHVGKVDVPSPGLHLIRVEAKGELSNGQSVRRIEFTTVQVGRTRDPRLTLSPREYHQGGTYSVDVAVADAEFGSATQIRFGAGITLTGFTVLDERHARAEIEVAADAVPGARSVVTYRPAAEDLAEIEVIRRKQESPRKAQRICCLHFDASGALTAVKLCDGKTVRICKHHDRLQKLLERARDEDRTITLHVDGHGCLNDVEICR